MITIKDYAKTHNVSYEAVRKQVERYKKDLDGHITKKNRTQYLDDIAVSFLNERRAEKQIIIEDSSHQEIENLKAENDILKKEKELLTSKIIELQDSLIKEKEAYKLLQDKQMAFLEKKEKKHWKFFKRSEKND